MKVSHSCPTLCDLMDYTVHGILQARILAWVAFPFSRGSSQPRSPTLQVDFFFFFFLPAEPQGKLVREGSARMGIYNSSMIFVILFWEGLPYLPFAFVTLGCSMFLLLVLNVSRQLNEIRLQLSRMEEGHPGGSAVKNMLQYRRCGFNPCFGRRK